MTDDPKTDEQCAAEADAISRMVVMIIRQACEQGVEPIVAAAAVLGVGAKGLCLDLGPEAGARIVRQVADQVEADRGAGQVH